MYSDEYSEYGFWDHMIMQSMFLYFKSRELLYRVGIPAIKFNIETVGAGFCFGSCLIPQVIRENIYGGQREGKIVTATPVL